jgi:ADP-heptose:LPS heptosyltransferase
MRVGIAWSGNPRHKDDARRSIPFEVFSTLLAAHPGVEFHSLQKDISVPTAHAIDHATDLHDFGDTGALVSLMDLVISVDTSVVHLAGALGRPVWVLLMHLADWRWLLEREDSPWYPSMRLLRQPVRGDWASVLAEASQRLKAL